VNNDNWHTMSLDLS